MALERSRSALGAPLATMAAKLREPSVGSEGSEVPTAKLFVPGTPRTEATGTPRNFL